MKCTPHRKGRASGLRSGAAWKGCSAAFAPALAIVSGKLREIHTALPAAWKDTSVRFLPKRHKPLCTAAALRPIGLLRPDGQALAGHVKALLLAQAGPTRPTICLLACQGRNGRTGARQCVYPGHQGQHSGPRRQQIQRGTRHTGGRRLPALS